MRCLLMALLACVCLQEVDGIPDCTLQHHPQMMCSALQTQCWSNAGVKWVRQRA